MDLDAIRDRGSPVPGFPKIQEAQEVRAHLELERKAIKSSFTPHGVFFRSDDDQRIAQFRSDGFTLNWLRPYSTWAEFSGQALEFWNQYVAIAEPQEVTRVAVRYINRFPIEVPVDLGNVFTVQLELPTSIEGVVVDFLYRATFRDAKSGKMCSMTLTGERRPPNDADVIFDIDCFEKGNFAPTDPVLWEQVLPALRELKNRVFFSGIKPAMLERFK